MLFCLFVVQIKHTCSSFLKISAAKCSFRAFGRLRPKLSEWPLGIVNAKNSKTSLGIWAANRSTLNHPDKKLPYERILYMIIRVLASLIGITIIISVFIRKSKKQSSEQEKSFWDRETEANSVRRKSLDGLNYIHIPMEDFPTHLLNDNATVMECIDILKTLSTQKIVNLTGMSNTDLKLEYGTANITLLSEYDQNYTLLVRTLQKWADALAEAGYIDEAAVPMEYAISVNTDISRTYYMLADYRISQGESFRVEQLINTAEKLNSANKDSIIRNLKEKIEG